MCNPSKKTIKRIDRILQSRCKKFTKFDTGVKLYNFRKATETGFVHAVFPKKAGYFIGTILEPSGVYKFFGIYSPEQVKEMC